MHVACSCMKSDPSVTGVRCESINLALNPTQPQTLHFTSTRLRSRTLRQAPSTTSSRSPECLITLSTTTYQHHHLSTTLLAFNLPFTYSQAAVRVDGDGLLSLCSFQPNIFVPFFCSKWPRSAMKEYVSPQPSFATQRRCLAT